MDNSKIETRSSSRKDINLTVVGKIHEDFYQKFGLTCGNVFKLTAIDISEAGIGVISKFFLPKGLILELDIEGIPGSEEKIMKIKGEIRYCIYKKNSGYRCGISFIETPDADRKTIAQLVATYEPRKFPRINIKE